MDEHGHKASLLTVKLKESLSQIPLRFVKMLLLSAVYSFPLLMIISTSRMKCAPTVVLRHKAQHHWLNCWEDGFEPSHQTLSCSWWGYEHIFHSAYSATAKAISIRRIGYNRWSFNLNHFVRVPKAHLSRMVQDCLCSVREIYAWTYNVN